MPELNEWMKICPDVTYFSTTWNTAEQIKKIVENRPFLFTHIADELFFFNLFKVQVTPTTLLVDKKVLSAIGKKVQARVNGPICLID